MAFVATATGGAWFSMSGFFILAAVVLLFCGLAILANGRRLAQFGLSLTAILFGGASPALAATEAEAESGVLFRIFGLEVTSVVTTMWGIILLLIVLALLLRSRLREVPGKLQNVVEMAFEAFDNFFNSIVRPQTVQKYRALFLTLFIFIAFSNYSGLLPSAGHLPGLAAPTSSLAVTVGLALVVFVATHCLGVRENGLKGYAKHFIKPVVFLLPLMILEEFVRPLSLSLRLYGNILGEETVARQVFEIVPLLLPLPIYVLSLLFCFLQALIFTVLASIYIDSATGTGH